MENKTATVKMINRSSITWNVKQIVSMYNKGKFCFDNIVQRSYVWEQERKSRLITTMILGYPIPPIYTAKEGEIYDIMDGKQRLLTMIGYCNGDFPLSFGSIPEPPIRYTDDNENEVIFDVTGKCFNDLPEIFQDNILSYSVTFSKLEDIGQEEKIELFRRINGGKSLSTKEKNISYCSDIENVMDIGKHPIFQNILTKPKLEKKEYVSIVMKVWSLLFNDIHSVSFDSRSFNELLRESFIAPAEKEIITEVLNYMQNVFAGLSDNKNVKKKFVKETHFVSICPIAKLAMDKKIPEEKFRDFVVYFFDTVNDESYNNCSSNRTATNSSISTRNDVLTEEFNNYFKAVTIENIASE